MLMVSDALALPNRDALGAIPTPDPTATWHPVPHLDLVNTLAERATARGLKIRAEKYAVLNGTMYPRPGMQIELRGARMFGCLDFAPIPGFPPGCTPSAGVRNC